MITEAEANTLIPDATAFYKAMGYNQHILPPMKDTIVTR